MAEVSLFITRNLQEFSRYINLSDISALTGTDFAINFDVLPNYAMFVIKKTKEHSVSDAAGNMAYVDAGADLNAWRLLSEVYTNKKISASTLFSDYGIKDYSEILSCLDDANFTGILLFNQNVTINSYEHLGSNILLNDSKWTVPLIRIEGVTFSEQGINVHDAHVKGLLHGCVQKHLSDGNDSDTESFDFKISDIWVDFIDGEFCLPQIICNLELYKIFGFRALMSRPLDFIGSYLLNDNMGGSTNVYQLRQLSEATVVPAYSPMTGIKFTSAQAQLNMIDSKLNISLNFRGRMSFGVLSDGNDFFSYDNLSFRNMRIDITSDGTNSSLQYNFREMLLSEDEAEIRKSSFLSCIQHGTPFVVSGQDCSTPANLQFKQMNVGSVQDNITGDDSWFGIAVPVNLFHGISVDILFAFAPNKFYAGYRLGSGVNSIGAVVSSLVRIETNEVQIEKVSKQTNTDNLSNEEIGYVIALRGAKFFVFGKEFPEGSADLVLIPKNNISNLKTDSDNVKLSTNAVQAIDCTGWYAIYDRMK